MNKTIGSTMTPEELKEDVQKYIRLSDNILIPENVDRLNIDNVKDGIITIWVLWSPGFYNCVNAIKLLQDKNYSGQIIIIDTDTIQPDFQKTVLKSRLHGWGEIFVIKNGQVVESFLGKESSVAFKSYINKLVEA